MAIILLAFVPVFALTGQEGKLFHPLAFTKTFAMLGATVLGVTLVPVLCSYLVRGPYHEEDRHIVMRFLMGIYEPTLSWALKHPRTVVGSAVVLLGGCLLVAFGLPRATVKSLADAGFVRTASLFQGFGREFMPPLNEGSLLHMPVLMPKTGLKEIQRVMSWQDKVMAEVPEIEIVAGKLGRFETATDPAPTEMLETTIMLKPEYIPDGRILHETQPRVARGHDRGETESRTHREDETGARLRARVSPAHREPHPHALHRHPRAGRREDLWRQSRRHPAQGL